MASQLHSPLTVVNEFRVPAATVQLVHYPAKGEEHQVMHKRDEHWLDLTLTPRPVKARANFLNHWRSNRFERIGRIFFVPSGEMLNTRGEGGPQQTSLVCHLNPEYLQAWLDEESLTNERHLSTCLDIADDTIAHLLRKLARELSTPSFGSEALTELISAELAIELSRHCCIAISEDRDSRQGLSKHQLAIIHERIYEVNRPPTLDELATLCRVSVRHLTRAYRLNVGRSIGESIADARMEHAMTLLQSDMSIKAIALTLGFSSSASFCHAFRNATQYSPGQYRTRYYGH